MVGTRRHQGVVARAGEISLARNLSELIDGIQGPPLLLLLDGVTDPHNLGACLRVADGAGAHAVIAPKDRAVGLNATAAKVASGAADNVPYITVTNLARAMRELQEHDIWLTGTTDDAESTIYDVDYTGGVAFVMGSEGEGMRRLTRDCMKSEKEFGLHCFMVSELSLYIIYVSFDLNVQRFSMV